MLCRARLWNEMRSQHQPVFVNCTMIWQIGLGDLATRGSERGLLQALWGEKAESDASDLQLQWWPYRVYSPPWFLPRVSKIALDYFLNVAVWSEVKKSRQRVLFYYVYPLRSLRSDGLCCDGVCGCSEREGAWTHIGHWETIHQGGKEGS